MKHQVIYLCLAVMGIFSSCNQGRSQNNTYNLEDAKATVDANNPHWHNYHEKGEILWYVNYEWYSPPPATSILVTEIERLTGTKIRFMVGNDDTLNQMIAAGEQLPDIITVDNSALQFTHNADRWAVPLNLLADKYDPYFYNVANDDTLKWYRFDDGNVYGYPSFSNAPEHFEGDWLITTDAFVVRHDIYKAIGSPDMQTPEGFLQALRDAKSYDPSIAPFSVSNLNTAGALLDTLMDFLAIPYQKNLRFYERLHDEEYLIWMETLRQAYHEDLIYDDEFSYDWATFEERVQNGAYFALLIQNIGGLHGQLTRNILDNPNRAYIAIDGPANQMKSDPTMKQNGLTGWTSTYITKGSKEKERAISLLTYLISMDGQILVGMGVEGITFEVNQDGLFQLLPEMAQMRNSDPQQFRERFALGDIWMLRHDELQLKYAADAATIGMIPIFAWTKGKAIPNFLMENVSPEPKTPEFRFYTNYLQERQLLAVNMLRSKSNEEMISLVNQFSKMQEKSDWKAVEKIINDNIAKNAQRLS